MRYFFIISCFVGATLALSFTPFPPKSTPQPTQALPGKEGDSAFRTPHSPFPIPPPKFLLSEYGFFQGQLSDLQPANEVFLYEVNAPLFTDYAEKSRFIYLPAGQKLGFEAAKALSFPEGAAIIKNFFYYHDATQTTKGRRILETRVLLKTADGWKALDYVWKDDQSDAQLEVGGATLPVAWKDASGKKQTLDYLVPNQNQCKGCHAYDGAFTPIGVTLRQLNNHDDPAQNQLLQWQKAGRIELPADFNPATAARLADYRRHDADLNTRARAYLDGNCAHCHNAHGPASTSGMFLEASQSSPERIGVMKTPVAAGRGSGNRKFGIVPGAPNESILVYRIESKDPGVQMPEIGRQMVHKEGVELIKQWIREMK